MDIKEILDALRAVDADTLGDVGGYADQIAQYLGDLQTGSDATIAELNKALEANAAEIQRLQAENYRLMTANASAGEGADDGGEEPDGSEDREDEDEYRIDIEDYIK